MSVPQQEPVKPTNSRNQKSSSLKPHTSSTDNKTQSTSKGKILCSYYI